MKITKKEIRELIAEIKNIVKIQGWELDDAGSYIKDGKAFIFGNYKGESVSEAVYNKQYQEIIRFDDVIVDYFNREYDLKDTVDIIYDSINNMIESYKHKNQIEIKNNVATVLKNKGISIRKMSMDLKLDYSMLHALVNRESLGSTALERIIEISNYLDVDIKELYE